MLQCTPTAAMTLRQIGVQQGFPETYGVRVFPTATAEGEQALAIGFAERPAEGDQVDEQHGTRIFVAGEVADRLSGVELDLVPDVSANGDRQPQLVLRTPPAGPEA